jgi:hypothetical protein
VFGLTAGAPVDQHYSLTRIPRLGGGRNYGTALIDALPFVRGLRHLSLGEQPGFAVARIASHALHHMRPLAPGQRPHTSRWRCQYAGGYRAPDGGRRGRFKPVERRYGPTFFEWR